MQVVHGLGDPSGWHFKLQIAGCTGQGFKVEILKAQILKAETC